MVVRSLRNDKAYNVGNWAASFIQWGCMKGRSIGDKELISDRPLDLTPLEMVEVGAETEESLIKKDREDQRDPAMAEFLNKLATTYRDPALMPIHYSENANDHRTPLLS
ncbi:hypothetical protein IFM89_004565 [Coptis chinensis]|uniref:Uncharacterized protein n=1 Tax=Coptis chinensis TaxID=261450 RepID=A0A835H1I1_9MAGN|nr:hypothetical protein IFM89_004565 [Coptis chinensis]